MEVALLGFFFVTYILIRVRFAELDTKSDKERVIMAKGIDHFNKKNFDEAFVYFNDILQKNKKSSIAFGYRGLCHLQRQNYHSAIYDLGQALSFDYSITDFQIGKGRAHYELKEWQEAYVMFDKAVWYGHRENAIAFCWRGKINLELKKWAEAKFDFERAVELGSEEAVYLMPKIGNK